MEFCRYGVPSGETTVTCTAGVGTTIIEFGTLSRLTGNPVFEEAAMRALRGLWHHRSSIGLVGNHIDVSRYNCKKILYLKFRELATWMIFFENFVKLIHDVAISRINILIHIFIYSGKWTATDAGIGAGVDSYYEYLVKGAALLQRPELMKMFQKSRLAF